MQRQFQMSSIWSKLLGIWKWILGLLLVLLAVTAYNRAIALNDLEAQVSELRAAQYALLKDYLPAGTDQSSDMKKALIALLKASQSEQNETGFLQLLGEFTRAKSAYAAVTITRIGYQNRRLSIDVTSNLLSDVEALMQALESTGQAVKLDKLSIKPNLISGQFVLEEG
jgi:type II secretory pathway component PulL